jgi:hypothetical protein
MILHLNFHMITTSDGNLEVVRGTSINKRVLVKDIVFIDTCVRSYNNNDKITTDLKDCQAADYIWHVSRLLILGTASIRCESHHHTYAMRFQKCLTDINSWIMSGSSHIRSVLIGKLWMFIYFLLFRGPWVNSIKTDLHICNLWTGQFVTYKSV